MILTTRIEMLNSVNLSNFLFKKKKKKKKNKKEVQILIENVKQQQIHNQVGMAYEDPFGVLAKGIIDWFRSLFDNHKKKEK